MDALEWLSRLLPGAPVSVAAGPTCRGCYRRADERIDINPLTGLCIGCELEQQRDVVTE